MTEPPPADLVESSYYRPLFRLLARMDADILGIYAASGHAAIKSRFVGPLTELHRDGDLTVRQLADRRELSHSAMSQTVAAMRRAGLVELAPGEHDARTRVVRLTPNGREIAPLATAEWRATEATVRELDAQIRHPLMRAVAEVEKALAAEPFDARLRRHLDEQRSTSDTDP